MKSRKKKHAEHLTPLNITVLFQPEPEGGFTVLAPSLPGCVTYGKNLDEARAMAQEAVELYLETLAETNEPLPSFGPTYVGNVHVSVPAHAHA